MPEESVVKVPLVEPIVTIPIFELLHVPPAVISDNVVVPPTQKVFIPVIPEGIGGTSLIVIFEVTKEEPQPFVIV